MSTWVTLVPITALIALLIFLVKETLEAFRRKNADSRKVKALTRLLARECEINFWTLDTLRRIFDQIHTEENSDSQTTVTIERMPSGRTCAKIVSDDGRTHTYLVVIPRVHRELMSKFLLDVATLDQNLFEKLEPAFDSLAEIEHVREALININDMPESWEVRGFNGGIAGNALDEIENAQSAISTLYLHCTGHELKRHYLRYRSVLG